MFLRLLCLLPIKARKSDRIKHIAQRDHTTYEKLYRKSP